MDEIEKNNIEKNIIEATRQVSISLQLLTAEDVLDLYLRGEMAHAKDSYSYIERSRLIESLILGYPSPPIYAERNDSDSDSMYTVTKGMEVIVAIEAFVSERKVLQGLKTLNSLNGNKFSCLSTARKRRFYRSTVIMIVKRNVPGS